MIESDNDTIEQIEEVVIVPLKRGRPKNSAPKNNFINNKEFLAILIEYKKNPTRKLYNKIGEIVLMLANKYILKPQFVKYTKDRQNEMISNACLIMITSGIKKFDPERYDNPFAYMTQSCHNSFLQHINAEKLRETRYSNVSFLENLESVGNDE